MFFSITSYEYTSIRKLSANQLPELHHMYEMDTYGHVKGMNASLVHDGYQWFWIPHECVDFKVNPIPVILVVYTKNNGPEYMGPSRLVPY